MQPYLNRNTCASQIVCGESLSQAHVRHVWQLVLADRSQEAHAIGFHGTSLSALQVMMRSGFLPTGRSARNEGHIYFFPLSTASLSCDGFEPSDLDDRERFAEACTYAAQHTKQQLAAEALGLDRTRDEVWNLMRYMIDAEDFDSLPDEVFSRYGLSKDVARDVLHPDAPHSQAKASHETERGFILLLGRSALE